MTTTRQWYKLLILLGTMLTFVALSEASSSSSSYYSRNDGYYRSDQPDEYLMDLIARYGQTIMRARNDLENSKRTVDFGFSRGLSGAQEAKHRMGVATANYANGPGRKRRSGKLTDELYDFN